MSSFLCFPLSLSHGQANINAGALVGSYLVFDEFHLLDKNRSMATLFKVNIPAISKHLKNIFASGELTKDSVTENISATASDGKNYMAQFYNLDAIISVGYRVNSIRVTQFRQWATNVLRNYAIRGYVLDKKRMENGTFLDETYFAYTGDTRSPISDISVFSVVIFRIGGKRKK